MYEAIQLYQIGNFKSSNDNVRNMENGINWEHHKPGYYSVLSNNGCCASDSSWLAYILKGDYEDVGYLQISQTAVESGSTSDYYGVDYILGNIHTVQNLEDYANYYVSHVNNPPGLFIQEKMEAVPAIEGVWKGSTVTITYGEDQKDKLTVLYDNKNDNLELGFAKSPKQVPNWASICR